jgi:hypothetical protein
MQRREAEIGLRDRKCYRRPKERNDTGQIPTETAYPWSVSGFVVWKDWMVVMTEIEPVTPVARRYLHPPVALKNKVQRGHCLAMERCALAIGSSAR